MNSSFIKSAFAFLTALAIALLPAAAFASVEATAAADKVSVTAGDTVEITFTVNGKGMSAAEGSYTYDPALLTFAESGGGASDGFVSMVSMEKGGSSSLTAKATFTAAAAGTANIEFRLEKVLNYHGEEQGTAKASATITIAAAPPEPTPAPIDYATEGVPAQNLASETPMFIWRSLENVTIPSKYSPTTLDYHGETVAAAKVEDSDAPTLLYLSDATGEIGSYFIYDAAKDTLFPYQTVNSVSKAYIILPPDGTVTIPEGFAETSITVDEKSVPAWVSRDAQGDVYLLYGRNPDGEVGFYYYNPKDESMQRYAVLPPRPVQPEVPAPAAPTPGIDPAADEAPGELSDGMSVSPILFYSVCGIACALLIALVAVLVSHAREKAQRRRRIEMRRAKRMQEQSEESKEA